MGGEGVGLWESHNGGESWTQTQRPPDLPPEALAPDVDAAVTDEHGVWVLHGTEWTRL